MNTDPQKEHTITIGLWNANSLQATTISEVLSHCQSFTILFITETWILPPSLLNVGWTEFHTYGKPVFDRNNRRSRGSQGIVALINPSCPLPVSHLISSNPYILSLQLGQLRISCFYLPPSLSLSQATAALDSIPLDRNTILCGDFNARLSSLTGDTDSNPRGTQFKPWFEDRDLEVLNATLAYGIPTFTRMMKDVEHTSIIDLFITNNLTILQRPAIDIYSDLTMGSDHCLLSLTFDLELDNNAPIDPAALPPRRTWKLSKLNDPKVCAEYARVFTERSKDLLDSVALAHQDLIDYPGSSVSPDFDDINAKLCSAIYSSLDSSVGNKPKKAAHHAKYWTEELQATADFRNTCYKQWRRSSGIDKIVTWTKYIAANAKFRYQILVAKRLSWRDYCRSLEVDFNKAISQVKFGKRRREQSGTFSHVDGPGTAAKIMADHLEKVYDGQYLPASHSTIDFISSELPFVDSSTCTNDDTSDSTNIITAIDSSTSAAIFATSNIESYIGCLPRRKAPGIDHLRAEMLVPITAPLARILSVIFQLCWSWSTVPTFWRHAQVFPIHKKGDATDPANFRPISLTSILRKLLEMLIQNAVKKFSPPLDIAQGGFRTRRSALDQALCLHDLIQHYNNVQHLGHYPIVAFLDIKSAYDTVDRNIVWKALRLTGTPLPLLGLLQHLFDDVQISTLIGNHSSPSFSTKTGFLQGSVLSPLLYSIFINSLPNALRVFASATTPTVLPEATTKVPDPQPIAINSLLFADDVAIFGTKNEVKSMLDAAAAHSLKLGYRWNPTKCAVLNHPIGRTASQVSLCPLKLYNVALPQVESFVYLGVPFVKSGISGSLLASQRAQSTMAAMSTLHKMGAHRSGFPLLLSSRLYKTFIRPKFEYGLAIAKLLKKDLVVLEKLQDRCFRLLVGGHSTSSTTVLKIMTDTPSVSWRVEVLQLKYCLRFEYLSNDCLVVLLHKALVGNYTMIRSHTSYNRLLVAIPRPVPVKASEINEFIYADRQKLYTKFRDTTDKVLAKACRNYLEIDPILYIPASRTDRSRLLRWRMGWLPGKPHDCACDSDHTSRRHFTKYECTAIPGDLWDELPHPPPDTHIIDFAISKLPRNISQFCSYWPALLSILWYIEVCVSPSGHFPEDLEPGALWRSRCKPTTNSTPGSS
jgi:hypothetical protein